MAACTAPGTVTDGYRLVSTDGPALATVGAARVVEVALASGRAFTTADELASAGAGLQTLVLARLTDDEARRAPLWVVDGWALLRGSGAGVDLRGADLRGARLRGARMSGANLEDADLRCADLERAELAGANLTGAALDGSLLFSATLHKADLTEASMCRADLRYADLRESVCVRTAFRGADLWGAYMWDVDVSQAFTEGTDFERSDHLNEKV